MLPTSSKCAIADIPPTCALTRNVIYWFWKRSMARKIVSRRLPNCVLIWTWSHQRLCHLHPFLSNNLWGPCSGSHVTPYRKVCSKLLTSYNFAHAVTGTTSLHHSCAQMLVSCQVQTTHLSRWTGFSLACRCPVDYVLGL